MTENTDLSAAQRKATAIIVLSLMLAMALCGVLNLWLVKDAAANAMPDRWTGSDMRKWVEQAEQMTGINFPTPEHKEPGP